MSYSAKFAKCHPDKYHMARGLCSACYERWRLCEHDPSKLKKRAASKRYNKKNRVALRNRRRKWRKAQTKEFLKGEDLKANYGITIERYKELVVLQESKCAICHKNPKNGLVVDHSHITGQVRGLLCSRCNSVLGEFENIEWHNSAKVYLNRGQDGETCDDVVQD